MAKILLLTALVLSAGADVVAKTISESPKDAAEDILSMQTEINELTEKLKSSEKLNDELIAEMEKSEHPASAEIERPKLSDRTFKVGKKTYGFAYPQIRLNGELVTNDDVLASKEMQEKLVEIGSGFIIEK